MKKMRSILLSILILTQLTNCSKNNDCSNRFNFVSCNDSIPILNLDINKESSNIRSEMNDLYGFDLCEKCSFVDFRLPFDIEGQKGYLKIMADFDSPYCKNCPLYIGLRHHFSIKINQKNQLLVDGDFIKIDSLEKKIKDYLETVGNNEMAPETFKEVTFNIFWNKESNIDFLRNVLAILYKSHLSFVELELKNDGIGFCDMENTSIAILKEKYPLRIEFDLEKNKGIISPNLGEL